MSVKQVIGLNGVQSACSDVFFEIDSDCPTAVGNTIANGTLRLNPLLNAVEVFNGVNWIMLPDFGTVELCPETHKVLAWAQKKMQEEQQLEKLMGQYPALKSAKEQFDITKHLVQNEELNDNT